MDKHFEQSKIKLEIADTTQSQNERHAQMEEASDSSNNTLSFEHIYPIRKRKLRQVPWNKPDLDKAVEAVYNRKMTLTVASQTFHVPRSTIHDHVKKLREGVRVVPRAILCYQHEQLDEALQKVLAREMDVITACEEFNVPRSTLYDRVRQRRHAEKSQRRGDVDVEENYQAKTLATGLAVEAERMDLIGEVPTTKTLGVLDKLATGANSNKLNAKNKVGRRPRGTWKQEDMIKAFNAVREKRMTIRKASQTYNIPNSTLGDRLTGKTGLVLDRQRRKSKTNQSIAPNSASAAGYDSGSPQVIVISDSTNFSEEPLMSYVNPLSVSTTDAVNNVAMVREDVCADLRVPPSETVCRPQPTKPVCRQESKSVCRQESKSVCRQESGPVCRQESRSLCRPESRPAYCQNTIGPNKARVVSNSTHVALAASNVSLAPSPSNLSLDQRHGRAPIESKTVSMALPTGTSASYFSMANNVQQTNLVGESELVNDTSVSNLRGSTISPLNSPNSQFLNLTDLPSSQTRSEPLNSVRCFKCLQVNNSTNFEALQTFETFLTESQLSEFSARYQEQFNPLCGSDTLYELWFKLRAAADVEQSAGLVPWSEQEARSQSPETIRRRKGKPKRLGNQGDRQPSDSVSKSMLRSVSDQQKGRSESINESNQSQ